MKRTRVAAIVLVSMMFVGALLAGVDVAGASVGHVKTDDPPLFGSD